ncbi:MAG: hypothetical protein OEX00_10130, partial [Gammaproteobacteria bacterium]|nr:hypothetical protein [Gammaproteobacteria bacterium]
MSDQQGWLRFFDRESHSSGYITQSEIQQISVNQNLIHLAHGSAGYSIYEVSAKEGPLWKGSYNKLKNIQTLDVENEHSIVADEHGTLSYFDISGPDDPLLVSEFVLKHPVQQIALVDRHVIAQHDSTLSVIDFSHQSTPTISNLGVNLGGSRRSFLVDHILYVADWFAGVHIYDVSQATRPMHLSSYHTPGSPKGVVVKNGIAYIADDDWGLHIIDVKDPRHPKKVAQLALDGLAYTMQLRQNILFLASHRGGLHIIDIGNPAQPKLLSTYNSPGKTWALALKDDLAFLADDNSGVIVLDIRDLHSPKAMHQYDTGGHAEDILLKDNIAYVAYFDQGVQILDISDVTNFKLLSHIPSPENARDVELHGNQLFVANWYGGVGVYEIADLRKPRHIGRYDTDGATWGIQLDLPHVYALDWWGGVKVLDFSASRKPQEVARYQGDGIAGSLALEGNYAFVANPNRGLDVFDIKNTLNPVWTTAVEIDGGVSTLLAKDGLVFALNGSSNLYIADISDPFHAKKMEDISLAHAGKSLSADLSSIYISDNKGHISALELKNLTRPQKIASQHSDCVLASAEMPLLSCEQGKKVYLIDKLTLKPVAITGSKFVKTDRGLLAYQENVGFTLFDLNQDKATTKKQIPHPSPILDFVANN